MTLRSALGVDYNESVDTMKVSSRPTLLGYAVLVTYMTCKRTNGIDGHVLIWLP